MTEIDGLGWDDDVAFARHLVEEVGVAVVPGSSFYQDPADGRRQVRFAFCKKDATLASEPGAEARFGRDWPPRRRRRPSGDLVRAIALSMRRSPPGTPAGQAEQLAQRATDGRRPAGSVVADARKALSLTADFEPTAFVKPGRKGEVVEDEYVAARSDYRRHRAQTLRRHGAVPPASGR